MGKAGFAFNGEALSSLSREGLLALVASMGAELGSMGEELRERDRVIESKDDEIRAKDGIIESKDNEIKSKLEEIKEKDEEIKSSKAEIKAKEEEIERQKAKIAKLNEALAKALAKIAAKNQTILKDNFNMIEGKSEHKKALRQAPINEAEAVSGKEGERKGKRGRKAGKKAETLTPEALEAMVRPEDIVHIDPKEANEEGWQRFGEDVSYKIVRVPASFRVIKVIRGKYRKGDEIAEELSDDPLPHSYASPSLISDVLSMKFELGVPLYRYGSWLDSRGLTVSEATMANWVIKASEILKPIASLMADELFSGSEGCIHSDETELRVIGDGSGERKQSYVFVLSSSYYAHPVDLYEFKESRKADWLLGRLKGLDVTLVCDAYPGYKKLGVRRQLCWAHVRRRFFDIYKTLRKEARADSDAGKVVAMIDAIFAEERAWREACLTSGEIKEKRGKEPYLAKVHGVRDFIERMKPAPGSRLEEARSYFLNLGDDLYTYLDDGRVPMTNNLAERAVKPFVIDRKNFLFAKSNAGAEAAGIAMTVIRTALRNGLIPERYIEWAIANSVRMKPEELLPWSDKVPDSVRAFPPEESKK